MRLSAFWLTQLSLTSIWNCAKSVCSLIHLWTCMGVCTVRFCAWNFLSEPMHTDSVCIFPDGTNCSFNSTIKFVPSVHTPSRVTLNPEMTTPQAQTRFCVGEKKNVQTSFITAGDWWLVNFWSSRHDRRLVPYFYPGCLYRNSDSELCLGHTCSVDRDLKT